MSVISWINNDTNNYIKYLICNINNMNDDIDNILSLILYFLRVNYIKMMIDVDMDMYYFICRRTIRIHFELLQYKFCINKKTCDCIEIKNYTKCKQCNVIIYESYIKSKYLNDVIKWNNTLKIPPKKYHEINFLLSKFLNNDIIDIILLYL